MSGSSRCSIHSCVLLLLGQLKEGKQARMPTYAVQLAKRALVVLLHALAQVYDVRVTCARTSPDAAVLKDFRRLVLKAHPDRGGSVEHQQQLNDARAAWERAQQGNAGVVVAAGVGADAPARREFRINASAALLTYHGLQGYDHWVRFNTFVEEAMPRWRVKHWCTTLEQCPTTAAFHVHVMLQFTTSVDKTAAAFIFDGLRPNVAPTDLCGEGLCRKKLQTSIDRGFFYVWADKVGTVRDPGGQACVAGNYAPCWTLERFRYQVLGGWPEKLWKLRKLTSDTYRSYLFLSRDGVVGRKRNLDMVAEEEERLELAQVISENTRRIRNNPALYRPFPEVPEVTAWLQLFQSDALRYPVLLLLGQSMSGKTEFANSLFKNPLELKIGPLLHFPDKLWSFDRKTHDGIVLDDVRDLRFLTENQDKIQGKYNVELEFGVTPGGQCKYEKYLFRIPIVATLNYSTLNLEFLESHDWLGKAGNRGCRAFPRCRNMNSPGLQLASK